jgi:hypothetical protein
MANYDPLNKADFSSIGFLDFGNNDLWEVYTPMAMPEEPVESFVRNNFPVYLASHDSPDNWAPLSLFLSGYYLTPHIVEIMIQLGNLLDEYVETAKENGLVDPETWAGQVISDTERQYGEDRYRVIEEITRESNRVSQNEPKLWRMKVASELNAYIAEKRKV